jgi:hypothetical protein
VRKLIKIALIALGIRGSSAGASDGRPRPSCRRPRCRDGARGSCDELRQKLAESRVDEPDDEPASEESVEDRRAEVHEQGRAALDEMKPSDEG